MRHRTQPGAVTIDSTRRALESCGMIYLHPPLRRGLPIPFFDIWPGK